MGIDGTAPSMGFPTKVSLPEAFRQLNERRLDLDRRLLALPPADPDRDVLWMELEPVLAQMRDVVGNLAKSTAIQLSEVQAKAAVLASLTRPGGDGSGAIIPDTERAALTLSLTDDIARLTSD